MWYVMQMHVLLYLYNNYCISIEPRWKVGQNGKGNFACSQIALHCTDHERFISSKIVCADHNFCFEFMNLHHIKITCSKKL